jgi:hypothetical protein
MSPYRKRCVSCSDCSSWASPRWPMARSVRPMARSVRPMAAVLMAMPRTMT